MDGVDVAAACNLDNGRDVEVGDRRRGGKTPRLIREPRVHGLVLAITIDGNRANTELMSGADHPYSDLTPIGDE
jgi:hypothetical protein